MQELDARNKQPKVVVADSLYGNHLFLAVFLLVKMVVALVRVRGNNVYLDARIPYSNHAGEFYLRDQYLAPLSISDYVITSDTEYPGVNLSPDNTAVYLFRKK